MTISLKIASSFFLLIVLTIYCGNAFAKNVVPTTKTTDVLQNTQQLHNNDKLASDDEEINAGQYKHFSIACGRDLSFKSPDGNHTELDEFPWLALLEYRTPFGLIVGCGGVLISNRFVLTAAHCITNLRQKWTLIGVNLGEYNVATDIDCMPNGDEKGTSTCWDSSTFFGIEAQIYHKDYNLNNPNNAYDIALLKLARDVTFSSAIAPICLPTTSTIRKRYFVGGWGKTGLSRGTDLKMKSKLQFVENNSCEILNNRNPDLRKDQICVAANRLEENTCIADSGGPLMTVEKLPDRTMRWVVAGVFSIGYDICERNERGQMGVYANIFNNMEWIEKNMQA